MARRVYFSFHHDRDIIRVSQIRNCGIFGKDDAQPFLDKAEWEKIKLDDDKIIKWIHKQMDGTSVLILCIGAETYDRKWVRYEIKKAHLEKRGIIGIRVHQQKDFEKQTDYRGINPLSIMHDNVNGNEISLEELYHTYDWIDDNGRENIQQWVEEAAINAGR